MDARHRHGRAVPAGGGGVSDEVMLTQNGAAKLLGIGWHTFEKRRRAGLPLYQPDHVDPDSGRRTYDAVTMMEARRELGRRKVAS